MKIYACLLLGIFLALHVTAAVLIGTGTVKVTWAIHGVTFTWSKTDGK